MIQTQQAPRFSRNLTIGLTVFSGSLTVSLCLSWGLLIRSSVCWFGFSVLLTLLKHVSQCANSCRYGWYPWCGPRMWWWHFLCCVCLRVSGLRGSKFSAPGSGASVTDSGLWSLMLPAELAWTNLGVDWAESSYEFWFGVGCWEPSTVRVLSVGCDEL